MVSQHLNIGIIGYGTQGAYYTKLIEGGEVPHMELMAVSARNLEQATTLQKRLSNIKVFTDYREMIDSGLVQGVIITVPPYFHPEIAMYALEKNVHVLNEKPAGIFTKQVKEMDKVAASKPDIAYAMMFNQRISPLYQKIKEIIENNEIGMIRSTNWIITTMYRPQAYYDQSEWRGTWGGEGGGVLLNQAAHHLDLLQWMTGIPKSVYAKVNFGSYREILVEDEVTAILQYQNGGTGVFVTNIHDLIGTNRLEIVGDKGKVIVENDRKAVIKRFILSEQEINLKTKASGTIFDFPENKKKKELIKEESFTTDSLIDKKHVGLLENFARHIIFGEELLAPGNEGINSVRLANAMYLSSWLKKEVLLEEFDDNQFLDLLNKRILLENKYKTW